MALETSCRIILHLKQTAVCDGQEEGGGTFWGDGEEMGSCGYLSTTNHCIYASVQNRVRVRAQARGQAIKCTSEMKEWEDTRRQLWLQAQVMGAVPWALQHGPSPAPPKAGKGACGAVREPEQQTQVFADQPDLLSPSMEDPSWNTGSSRT